VRACVLSRERECTLGGGGELDVGGDQLKTIFAN
jgi:hypothetical protein